MLGKGARPVPLEHLCVAAHGVRGLCLQHGGGDGLICACQIGVESVSASSLGVGAGGNGCGGCGDGDLSLAQRGTQLGAMSELARALLTGFLSSLKCSEKSRRNLSFWG